MTLRSERILVTGGSGFLGQHIVKLLQERTDYVKEIRVLDLKPFTKQLGFFYKKFTSDLLYNGKRAKDMDYFKDK